MNTRLQYGEMIKRKRESMGLSQEEFGKIFYVEKQSVSNWERGKNFPGEDIREKLAAEYGIALPKSSKKSEVDTELMPLTDIHTEEELNAAIDYILSKIKIEDAYYNTLRTLLELSISLAVGYELYYLWQFTKTYWNKGIEGEDEFDSPDWGCVGYDLQALYSEEFLFTNKPSMELISLNEINSYLKPNIEIMTHKIEGEIFEDSGEKRTKNLWIGEIAMWDGGNLYRLLPKEENSLLTAYKVALYNVGKYLQSLY